MEKDLSTDGSDPENEMMTRKGFLWNWGIQIYHVKLLIKNRVEEN